MEPIPEYIAFVGEFVETVPGGGPVRLFRVIVCVSKLAEHYEVRARDLDFARIAQVADEEREAFTGPGRENMRLPVSGSVAEPVVVEVDHVQFTWMVR